MTAIIDKCMSVKNKNDINTQCPYQRKIGEFCGIHSKCGEKVIRIDQRELENNLDNRILLQLTFRKMSNTPHKNIFDNVDINDVMNDSGSGVVKSIYDVCKESEFYDKLECLIEIPIEKLNYAKIIKSLIHFQIQITGNKQQLINKLIKHIKSRDLIKQAREDLSLCNNTSDFYDFVDLKEIPKEYLFIFMCEDDHLYGMDLRSMHTYFIGLEKDAKLMERPVEYKNPYNRCLFSTPTICAYRQAIQDLQKQNRFLSYPDEEHNPEDKIAFKILEVFHLIYTYGYAVDGSWFIKMGKADLLDYYLVMEDIWNQRFNISLSVKRNIVPSNVNIFNKSEYYEIREYNKLKLQELLINKIELMVNSGIDRDSRILGIHYTLIGLCETCDITSLAFSEDN